MRASGPSAASTPYVAALPHGGAPDFHCLNSCGATKLRQSAIMIPAITTSCPARAIRPCIGEQGGRAAHIRPIMGSRWVSSSAYRIAAPRPRWREVLLAIGRCLLPIVVLLAFALDPSRAEDLERGKSGPAIFAADCAACHRTAQGLAYGMGPSQLMDLLRQHYTTGPGPANQVAPYLLSVVGNGRRPKEKPSTEPQPAALAEPEAAGKHRPRSDEAVTAPAQRPPAEILSETGSVEPQQPNEPRPPALGAKRHQQSAQPAEPAAPTRSSKLGQPANAARRMQPDAMRPPESIPRQPAQSAATRAHDATAPSQPRSSRAPEPVATQPVGMRPAETAAPAPPSASVPEPKPEAKSAEPPLRREIGAPAAESVPEPSEVHAAAPAERAVAPKSTPRERADDQSAFSAPSP